MLFWQGGGTSSHCGDRSGWNTAPKRCVTWQSVALRLQHWVIQWPTNVESEAFILCKCFVIIYAWFVDLDNLHVCVRIVHRCTVIYCALLRRDVAALGSKLCSSQWNWFFLMGLGFWYNLLLSSVWSLVRVGGPGAKHAHVRRSRETAER